MALAEDVQSTHISGSDIASFTTGNHAAGTPTYVTIEISWRQLTSANITGVTYGGTAMTQEKEGGPGGAGSRWAEVWYLAASIPTGTQTASVTWTGGNARGVAVTLRTYTGTSPSITHSVSGNGTSSGASPNVTATAVNSAANDRTYGVISCEHSGSTVAPNGGETEKSEIDTITNNAGHTTQQTQFEAGAGPSVTHDWTVATQFGAYSYVVYNLHENAGGAGVTGRLIGGSLINRGITFGRLAA